MLNFESMKRKSLISLLIIILSLTAFAQEKIHLFSLSKTDFLLDNKSFQIISGEMHPARIPVEYWRQRIQMAEAMGCNTIAAYIFWNYQESQPGVFDFQTGNHNIVKFIKMVQEEGMWLILRPGPYVCAEWDFGGLPSYLLSIPDIKVRCMDPRYIEAVDRYIKRVAVEVKNLQVTKGGPIVMVQVENEYGSYGNDRQYMKWVEEMWKKNGIEIPFYTADGATPFMLEAGSLPDGAIGLDPAASAHEFAEAAKSNPNVPSFCAECYPGWLTHWGEKMQHPDSAAFLKNIKWLMDNKKSFNFYVIHGGTNFEYTAGANSGGKGYEPDVTSYDYDAPINEQGKATPKYMALRELIGSYLPKGKKLFPIPITVPTIELTSFEMQPFSSVWDNLPQPVNSIQPKTFEAYGQDHGFILYKTELVGHKNGKLTVNDIHDYATVFLNGNYIGKLDRREGINSIDIPASDVEVPVLEIFVEAMGRINFGKNLIDRKGITDSVTLNGTALTNWQIYNLPMDKKYIWDLRSSGKSLKKPGVFFKGNFVLSRGEGNLYSDTYIDVSNYTKGIAWINGHNLGHYWNIGTKKRLYCPYIWLREGVNEIMVFDLHQTEAKPITGAKTLEN